MNDIPKIVFSRTLERADWADSRIARGDLAEEIAAIKREPGKDMIALRRHRVRAVAHEARAI